MAPVQVGSIPLGLAHPSAVYVLLPGSLTLHPQGGHQRPQDSRRGHPSPSPNPLAVLSPRCRHPRCLCRRPRQGRGRVLSTGHHVQQGARPRAGAQEVRPVQSAGTQALWETFSSSFHQTAGLCSPPTPSSQDQPLRADAVLSSAPDCTRASWTGHPGAPGGCTRGAPLCRAPRGPLPGRPGPTASLLPAAPAASLTRRAHTHDGAWHTVGCGTHTLVAALGLSKA